MQISINGQSRSAPDGFTIAALLSELQLHGKRLAVEVNEDVIPRSEHPAHVLCEGDRVEIVHAIGGG
jgi:sulfur carrier protein